MSFLINPKRKVNLGNKQQSTRADLLKRAQEERLQRQQNRQQTEAAVALQRAVRLLWTIRREKRRKLREFESRDYENSALMLLDFIYFVSELDSASNVDEVVARVAAALTPGWLRLEVLKSLNVLWEKRAKCCINILPLYGQDGDLPEEIVPVLHKAASAVDPEGSSSRAGTAAQGGFEGDTNGALIPFFRSIFARLAALHPQSVLSCILQSDTLINLGVDLSQLHITYPQLLETQVPKPRILRILSLFVQSPVAAAPLIVQLVSALPHRIGHADAEALEPLLAPAFLNQVLALTPLQLAAFLLPLVNSPPAFKNQLLLQLTLAPRNLIAELWAEFTNTNALEAAKNFPAVFSPNQLDSSAWTLLVPMLELYSYWLIVCNDGNMFEVLDRDQTQEVAQVLRGVCYANCWHNFTPISHSSTAIFYTVIRQLYVRSQRRAFLPANFWLIYRNLTGTNLTEFMQSIESTDFQASMLDPDTDSDDEDSAFIEVRASPAVEMLKRTPFFVDFMHRATIFSIFTAKDKLEHRHEIPFLFDGRSTFQVNRESLVEDTAAAFWAAAPESGLKSKLRFTILSNGEEEVGIDGGGLTKEVLTSVCQEIFVEKSSPKFSDLFIETPDHALYPNPKYNDPRQYDVNEIGNRYWFLGAIIGKIMHENVMIDVQFAPFFLQKWAGTSAAKSSFDDFWYLDPEMYNGLLKLLEYKGDVEDLALDFTADDGQGGVVPLRPNGENVAVTNANKLEYIHLLSNYKLNTSIRPQTRRFLQGVTYFISPQWLKMFSPPEIQTLISGETCDFDIEDLRRHTDTNGFAQDRYVDYFWQVVEEMTSEERQRLLKFVTSVPRSPLLGFSKLTPRFGLRSAGRDDQRLPTASTCVNLLKLPEYSTKEILREKLLYSINSGAGFDLS